MDFARKQLEKYGWTDGKGLGKHENGISEALKPKLKRSVTGVGHDAAAEFTEHWWTKLYNTAASNVEVKEKNGKTKKIKTKDDDFEITNTWSYKKKNKSKSKKEYTNFFVKTSILTSGGVKTEDLEGSENEIENENKEIVKLSDEQLFAACEGRTAHKGARHGLKALGKLARIEMQEQMLLQQSKYNGYSQAKNKETNITVEDMSLLSDCEEIKVKKKKKKKKHCSVSDTNVNDLSMENTIKKVKQKKLKDDSEEKSNDAIANVENNSECRKIKKKKKRKSVEQDDTTEDSSKMAKKSKKNRHCE